MDIESTFIQEAKVTKHCEVGEQNGHNRVVEPYMGYFSTTGRLLFHCYQVQRYTARAVVLQGGKNPQVDSFLQPLVCDETFTTRREYEPLNYEMFPIVHLAMPSGDSRERIT